MQVRFPRDESSRGDESLRNCPGLLRLLAPAGRDPRGRAVHPRCAGGTSARKLPASRVARFGSSDRGSPFATAGCCRALARVMPRDGHPGRGRPWVDLHHDPPTSAIAPESARPPHEHRRRNVWSACRSPRKQRCGLVGLEPASRRRGTDAEVHATRLSRQREHAGRSCHVAVPTSQAGPSFPSTRSASLI